jgi:membrane-associated phospholipid phosphatase
VLARRDVAIVDTASFTRKGRSSWARCAVAEGTASRPGDEQVAGPGFGVVLAAYLAGAVLEVVRLFIERARPEEVLGAQVQLSHGRTWAHIASYPSGHMIVTAAMAAAAAAAVPALRRPLIGYVALVALTRVTFGAHFPIDVLVGAVLGRELGLFAARLMASARLLPAPSPAPPPTGWPLRPRPRERLRRAA